MNAFSGMASAGRAEVAPLVLGAWDEFLDVAASADLDRPSRLPGWRGHEVCVHLGSWDDYRALDRIVESARTGAGGEPPDPDAANALVTAAHRNASRGEVLQALERHRDTVRSYLDDADPALDPALDLAPAMSTVGPLPLLSVVLGEAYELAVHALDLADCGARAPSAELLQAGLAALADVTGALAAAAGIEGGASLLTPDGGWTFASDGRGWTVERTGTRRPDGSVSEGSVVGGSVVEGSAQVLLDASAGRGNPVVQLARRRLKVHHPGGLLRLVPIVEAAPGIPGAPILRLAAQTLSGGRGLLGKLRPGG
jgi:uncharacterized protein (TIGR03083 family)